MIDLKHVLPPKSPQTEIRSVNMKNKLTKVEGEKLLYIHDDTGE